MGTEIERKFLVVDESWRQHASEPVRLRQAYLCNDGRLAIRVRQGSDGKSFLTIKTAEPGRNRAEFEYEIPSADAGSLFSLCSDSAVEKRRYHVRCGADVWEVDVFEGANAGLIIAELELAHTGQDVQMPSWTGDEVTDDARYYNANLARNPFRNWPR